MSKNFQKDGRTYFLGSWRSAYAVAVANAGIFLLMAFALFIAEPVSLAVILFGPAVFFLGSLLAFLLMVHARGELAAVSWFVLGAGIFFGLGAIAGGLHVHPHSDFLFGDDTQYLLQVNLLNACSVFIVLIAAYPLVMSKLVEAIELDSINALEQKVRIIFPWVIAIAIVGVTLKFVFFPVAENLLIRSIAGKINLIVPAAFLLLGLLWRSCGWPLKVLTSVLFAFDLAYGLIAFTKYQVIASTLALLVGLWFTRRSLSFVVVSLLIIMAIFTAINPIVTLGRAHIDYDPEKNPISTRLTIFTSAVNAFYFHETAKSAEFSKSTASFTLDPQPMAAPGERLRSLSRRFDITSVQGYLIREYNQGRPGESLHDFWVTMIPRVLWPEKPVITRFGNELNAAYYYYPGETRSQRNSSLAPSYSGEAYWNYGPVGVLVVSVLMGLAIGWFTRCWHGALNGRDPAFLLIAFPVAIWACFVESWLVATYLGEFIILALILFIARGAIAPLITDSHNKSR